jgi:hypothetical protein
MDALFLFFKDHSINPLQTKELIVARSKRELITAASKIRDCLGTPSASRYNELSRRADMLALAIERSRRFGWQLRICAERKWSWAAKQISSDFASSLRRLTPEIATLENSVDRLDAPTPSVRELVAELEETEREFGQLTYERKEQFVAVTTESIELEGMNLGEFEIRLLVDGRWDLEDQRMWHVVALDPHPAGADDSVTHPHVRDEHLCAGDATAAIRTALRSGRICDFYLLVRSVLQEYNPGSAFVRLDKWDGISCYDCGCNIGSGEVFGCPACENDFCDDCMSYCHCCDSSFCRGCLTMCRACHEDVCADCLTQCPDCRGRVCKKCLEENQCPCKQVEENDNESTTNVAAKTATG